MRDHRGLARSLAVWTFLVVVGCSASATATSLRVASPDEGGPRPPVSIAGPVLWTHYVSTGGSVELVNSGLPALAAGDAILRLINPNGSANPALGPGQTVCAMIYVFDDDEEMGECCGRPVSSAGFATFSVDGNLTSNWGIGAPRNGSGAITIAVTAQNDFTTAFPNNGSFCPFGASAACNLGCDPTNVPGFNVTNNNNLLGSITESLDLPSATGLTEIPLFNDADGDLTALRYLQTQCGALVGNASGNGICNCPPGG